jgi:thioredoxin reductase
VDGALRTSRPGVFAAGNLVHPVDTADVAAPGRAFRIPAVLVTGADPRGREVTVTLR